MGFIPSKLSRKQNFAKRICLQWTSSNKGLITFENLCISRLRCMSKVPVLQSWFKLLTLTKTARRLGISEACPRERDRTVLVLKALLPRPRRRRGRQRPRRPRRRPQPQPARMTHGGRQSCGAVLYCAKQSRGQSPHPVLYVLNSTKTVLLFPSFVGRIRRFLIKKSQKRHQDRSITQCMYTQSIYTK